MKDNPFELLISLFGIILIVIIIVIVLNIVVIPLIFISTILSLNIPNAIKKISIEFVIAITLAFIAVATLIIKKIRG